MDGSSEDLSVSAASEESIKKLWKTFETKLKCSIPPYLKNLMELQGFDTVVAIKNLDDDDVAFLEEYGRSKEYGEYLEKTDQQSNLKDFLGPYHVNQANFQILRGHKKLLKEIVKCASEESGSSKQGVFVVASN